MIIDCHGHYTTAPKALNDYRARQVALLAGPEEARREAIRALESYGRPTDGQAHVFNLGHGISQFTPPENVLALVETVHEHSRKQRLAG